MTCTNVVKAVSGAITAVHCTYDPATKGANAPHVAREEVLDASLHVVARR
ncbi:MAG: hypothetical protein MUC96_36430 [Myxococcaceae bacterium]|nr:hypothetical protein [Myxococcaceae bacterium]